MSHKGRKYEDAIFYIQEVRFSLKNINKLKCEQMERSIEKVVIEELVKHPTKKKAK